jgi:hypothetical protein
MVFFIKNNKNSQICHGFNYFKIWHGFYTINIEQENLVHLNKK